MLRTVAEAFIAQAGMTVGMERRGFVFHGSDGEAVLSLEQVMELADRGDPDGTYALALAFLMGYDAERDEVRGYALLERAVDLGNAEAMATMVRLFMRGDYGGIDSDGAGRLAIRAAEGGVADAFLYAGMAYLEGVGTGRDPERAAEWLRKAANSGNQEARTLLAHMFQEGIGVERDERKAYSMFRTAASAGCANAMYQTAACLELGIGTEADREGAKAWYARCAETGDAASYERLGMMLLQDGDAEGGFEATMRAAVDGVVTAMYTVGMCYLQGIGIPEDRDEAAKWLRIAADNEMDEASDALALIDGPDRQNL